MSAYWRRVRGGTFPDVWHESFNARSYSSTKASLLHNWDLLLKNGGKWSHLVCCPTGWCLQQSWRLPESSSRSTNWTWGPGGQISTWFQQKKSISWDPSKQNLSDRHRCYRGSMADRKIPVTVATVEHMGGGDANCSLDIRASLCLTDLIKYSLFKGTFSFLWHKR